jgi:hypothetical protein
MKQIQICDDDDYDNDYNDDTCIDYISSHS